MFNSPLHYSYVRQRCAPTRTADCPAGMTAITGYIRSLPMQPLRTIIALGLALSVPLALAQDQKDDHTSHHPAPAIDSGASQASGGQQGSSKASPAQENMNK